MSELGLVAGLTGTYRVLVGPEHTADHIGHAGVHVFSTPQLVQAFELACARALVGRLPPGCNHVGIRNQMTHLAPTPAGFTVTARAELVEVNGRRLVFRVEAHDGVDKIGEGIHERMIVDWPRFEARLAQKRAARGLTPREAGEAASPP